MKNQAMRELNKPTSSSDRMYVKSVLPKLFAPQTVCQFFSLLLLLFRTFVRPRAMAHKFYGIILFLIKFHSQLWYIHRMASSLLLLLLLFKDNIDTSRISLEQLHSFLITNPFYYSLFRSQWKQKIRIHYSVCGSQYWEMLMLANRVNCCF